jgi:uncharacterized membrane protein
MLAMSPTGHETGVAVAANLGAVLVAGAIFGGSCSKQGCEVTLTCPPPAAGGMGAAGGGVTAGAPSGAVGAGAGTSNVAGRGGALTGGTAGDGTLAGRGGWTSGGSGGEAGNGSDHGAGGDTAGTAAEPDNGGAAGANDDACDGVTCEHGGTCKLSGTSFKCECASGYDGKRCENDINECAASPCEHGGTCTDGIGEYTCACSGTGYFGERCETAHFEWLGVYGASVRGISADGRVVVGTIPGVSRDVPARWTAETGFEALESLTEPVDIGDAWAASADGSVIVGQASLASGGGAFRWTASTGLVLLGLNPESRAVGVSATGTTILGQRYGTEQPPQIHAFRWTAGTGVMDLVSLGSGLTYGGNAAGTAVVGSYTAGPDDSPPFRWTQTPGIRRLADENGIAYAISLDGTTVVGAVSAAFVFRNEDGFSYLPLPGLTGTMAVAVNGDGSLIGGTSYEGSWIWDATNGSRLLADALTDLGVDLSVWALTGLSAISGDGRVISGFGYKDGELTAWLARL